MSILFDEKVRLVDATVDAFGRLKFNIPNIFQKFREKQNTD